MGSKPKIDVQELIAEGEGTLVEFKESPAHIEKEICAFANNRGGTIYIGITDDGRIHPTILTNRLKSQLTSSARSCDPPPDIDIAAVGKVIALVVAESCNKPVRAPGGFYLRMGATSQKLTRDEILLFAVRETRILFDSQIYTDETAKACLSSRAIERFRQKAGLDAELDNFQLLENMGCIKRQNNRAHATYAGVLCFGKDPQKVFPHAVITVMEMEDPATIAEQRIIRGTLFDQVEEAFHFVRSHLRSRPLIESLVRQDVLELPEAVLRELLVNAVIHRDYFDRSADTVIKIFPDTIEHCNPGTVSDKIPLAALFGRSYRRNPVIAELFFRANYIERAGTGLLRVKKMLDQNGLSPIHLSEEGPFFVATLPRKTFHPVSVEFNERQRALVTSSPFSDPFSSAEYAKHFGVSARMARNDLGALIKSGLLAPIKNKRNVRYVLK